MTNDPHAYLSRIMGGKGMSKSAEGRIKVREHERAKPSVSVAREKPVAGAAPVKKPNIEGNESRKYEALEKKSLKSLAHGGSEKELREGHNDKGKSMAPGGGGRFAKMVAGIEKSGKSEESAKAIAAAAGRKKYGAQKMAEFAAKGRKRAAK
jgi:hypothetical protein